MKDLLIKAAMSEAARLELGHAFRYVDAAFSGCENAGGLKEAVETGVLEVFRRNHNRASGKINPYFVRVGDRYVHLNEIAAKCPCCDKMVDVNLRAVIENGLVVPDFIYCEKCREAFSDAK